MGRPGVEFGARKFKYLGAFCKTYTTVFFTKASGITNINKLIAFKTPARVEGNVPGNTGDNAFRILKEALGLPNFRTGRCLVSQTGGNS
jgi:hypothetical protein